MALQQELPDLTKRELEASKEVISKLMEHIMTKQTYENFLMRVEAVRKENTELKQRITELKKNDLAMLDRLRKKDSQIHELQGKIEQTVSEKLMLAKEAKYMVNKLEKKIEFHEQQRDTMSKYIRDLEAKLNERKHTINRLTQDLANKQEIINEQQKELETANIELRHYHFKDEVNELLSDVATGLGVEIKSLMEEHSIEGLGVYVKLVVEAADEDE